MLWENNEKRSKKIKPTNQPDALGCIFALIVVAIVFAVLFMAV